MNTRSNRFVGRLAGALLGVAVAAQGCASTEMTSTWTDPAAKGAGLSKIAVVCMSKDDGMRRMAEDAAAAQMPVAQAVPSYQVLGDVDLHDAQAVQRKLESQGFQGVLVMRLTRVDEQVTPVGGPYGTFDGYYAWADPMVYGPGYLETDTIVHVISNLYSLKDQGKLIWSGMSKTFDPASAKAVVTGVSKAVAKSIEKDRLVV
jgi:hypothetical protein